MLSIDAVYIPLRQPPTPAVVRTKMNITEMHDTIPIKLLWQIWYIHRKLLYFHLWKAQGKAVDEREKRTHRQYQSYEFPPVSALIAGTESKSAQLTTFAIHMHSQPIKLQKAKTNWGTANIAITPNQISISTGLSGRKLRSKARKPLYPMTPIAGDHHKRRNHRLDKWQKDLPRLPFLLFKKRYCFPIHQYGRMVRMITGTNILATILFSYYIL